MEAPDGGQSASGRLLALRNRVRAREAAGKAAREVRESGTHGPGAVGEEGGGGAMILTDRDGTKRPRDGSASDRLAALRARVRAREAAANIAGEGSHDGDDDAEEDEDAKEEGGSADSEVRTGEPVGCAASDLATSLPGAARELQWELGIQARGGSRLKESSGCLALENPASDAAIAAPRTEGGSWDEQAGGSLAEDEGAVGGASLGRRSGESTTKGGEGEGEGDGADATTLRSTPSSASLGRETAAAASTTATQGEEDGADATTLRSTPSSAVMLGRETVAAASSTTSQGKGEGAEERAWRYLRLFVAQAQEGTTKAAANSATSQGKDEDPLDWFYRLAGRKTYQRNVEKGKSPLGILKPLEEPMRAVHRRKRGVAYATSSIDDDPFETAETDLYSFVFNFAEQFRMFDIDAELSLSFAIAAERALCSQSQEIIQRPTEVRRVELISTEAQNHPSFGKCEIVL